jgi:hypothetical protein
MALVGLSFAALLAGVGCEYRAPARPKLPVQVEVESPPHLQVAVVDARKRPASASELAPFQRAGARWDYTVRFTDTGGVGLQFREVRATVRSLTGITGTRTIPLASRVEPHGMTPIAIHAFLSTSNLEEPGDLSGVQEL